ncbi:hypothetical protein MHBO_004234, partial [Bonamia ostreae]
FLRRGTRTVPIRQSIPIPTENTLFTKFEQFYEKFKWSLLRFFCQNCYKWKDGRIDKLSLSGNHNETVRTIHRIIFLSLFSKLKEKSDFLFSMKKVNFENSEKWVELHREINVLLSFVVCCFQEIDFAAHCELLFGWRELSDFAVILFSFVLKYKSIQPRTLQIAIICFKHFVEVVSVGEMNRLLFNDEKDKNIPKFLLEQIGNLTIQRSNKMNDQIRLFDFGKFWRDSAIEIDKIESSCNDILKNYEKSLLP